MFVNALAFCGEEGVTLARAVHCAYGDESDDVCCKEEFHAPRISRNSKTALYSEFANAKQKC
jgi:hypothetical protein